mgnify:CR=1 FL=1
MQLSDPLLLGCQISMLEALMPMLQYEPASLDALLSALFNAIEFNMAEDAAMAGKALCFRNEGRQSEAGFALDRKEGSQSEAGLV